MKLRPDRFTAYWPKPILDLLTEGVYLAGGALRACLNDEDKIQDFDLFFSDSLSAAKTIVALEEFCETVFVCPQGKLTTFKFGVEKVQCITERWYDSPKDLVDSFDINASRFVYHNGEVISPYSAIKDTLKKQVTLNRVDYPVATFKRIVKYHDKGFRITGKAILFYVDDVYYKGLANEQLNSRFYID